VEAAALKRRLGVEAIAHVVVGEAVRFDRREHEDPDRLAGVRVQVPGEDLSAHVAELRFEDAATAVRNSNSTGAFEASSSLTSGRVSSVRAPDGPNGIVKITMAAKKSAATAAAPVSEKAVSLFITCSP